MRTSAPPRRPGAATERQRLWVLRPRGRLGALQLRRRDRPPSRDRRVRSPSRASPTKRRQSVGQAAGLPPLVGCVPRPSPGASILLAGAFALLAFLRATAAGLIAGARRFSALFVATLRGAVARRHRSTCRWNFLRRFARRCRPAGLPDLIAAGAVAAFASARFVPRASPCSPAELLPVLSLPGFFAPWPPPCSPPPLRSPAPSPCDTKLSHPMIAPALTLPRTRDFASSSRNRRDIDARIADIRDPERLEGRDPARGVGEPYKVTPISLTNLEQKQDWYVALNPNGRIPTLIDHDAGDFAIFELGAIMIYLAEKFDRFLLGRPARSQPRDPVGDVADVGAGADDGAGDGLQPLFRREAAQGDRPLRPREPAAVRRCSTARLADNEYLAGDYSIADMACFLLGPRPHDWAGVAI